MTCKQNAMKGSKLHCDWLDAGNNNNSNMDSRDMRSLLYSPERSTATASRSGTARAPCSAYIGMYENHACNALGLSGNACSNNRHISAYDAEGASGDASFGSRFISACDTSFGSRFISACDDAKAPRDACFRSRSISAYDAARVLSDP